MLPFTDLKDPYGVAADAEGNVYVADRDSFPGRVLKLAPGSSSPKALPFTNLNGPEAVAVDAEGNVYVGSFGGVFRLSAGAYVDTKLPFSADIVAVGDVGVDAAGNVYVREFPDGVFQLPVG